MDIFQEILSHIANNIYGIISVILAITLSPWGIKCIESLKNKWSQREQIRKKEMKNLAANLESGSEIMRCTFFLQKLIRYSIGVLYSALATCMFVIISFISSIDKNEIFRTTTYQIAAVLFAWTVIVSIIHFKNLVRDFFRGYYVKYPVQEIEPTKASDEFKPIVD